MISILIVEDDPSNARMIEAVLLIAGYQGQKCTDGLQALELLQTQSFDLMLLDVMLPGLDGFSVLEQMPQSKKIPVIFLTAKQEVADKVRGLRLGAEDYIVKPFEAVELLARIEVALRRGHRNRNVLVYQNIVLNMEEHAVKMDNAAVSLTPKEFELMTFFLQNVDIALTRERLLAAVWGYEFFGETRTVDIHVQQLRKKLDLRGKLVTVSKLGYRLES